MATYNLREGVPSRFVAGDVLNYPYRLNSQVYGGSLQLRLPKGIYRLECWGSRSCRMRVGNRPQPEYVKFSTGGYAAGTLTLVDAASVYMTAGGVGTGNGGYGVDTGTNADTSRGVGSGSASDIRIESNTLYNRVLVAGGGGAPGNESVFLGGGGGAVGIDGKSDYTFPEYLKPEADEQGSNYGYNGTGGSATQAGKNGFLSSWSGGDNHIQPTFGFGGYYSSRQEPNRIRRAGGGGWYGGGYGGQNSVTSDQGSGGGSGFAYSEETQMYVPVGYRLTSTYWLSDTINISGWDTGSPITEPDGTTAQGHQDEGYVRITVIEVFNGIFIGSSSGKALAVKGIFIGDNMGKARKVIKGYIGDSSGKARRFL